VLSAQLADVPAAGGRAAPADRAPAEAIQP
jgi:hypothetical protein